VAKRGYTGKERLLKIQHKERNRKWIRMLGYIDRTDEIFGDDEETGVK